MSEKWNVEGIETWEADRIPEGVINIDAGNSDDYRTGGWRSERPVWTSDKCINCLICWIDCPDASILTKDREMSGIDLDHCKGCGICVRVCPSGALEMHRESEFAEEEDA